MARPPVLALMAGTDTPLSTVLALSGKPVEHLVAELDAAGIRVAGAQATIAAAVGGNRELEGRAMRVVIGQR